MHFVLTGQFLKGFCGSGQLSNTPHKRCDEKNTKKIKHKARPYQFLNPQIHAFNFIDGLDSLSSGIAVISSFSLLAVAVQFPDRSVAILLLTTLAGASLGFLRHNFTPAKIIMGDSGAYMLGYVNTTHHD